MCLAQFSKIFAIHSCTYQHCVLVSLSWFTGRASEFYFCAVFVPSILVWHCDHVLFWVDFLRHKSCINFHSFIHSHIHDWLGSVLCLHKQGLLILVLCVWFVCVTCVICVWLVCVNCVCDLCVWFVCDLCVWLVCVCVEGTSCVQKVTLSFQSWRWKQKTEASSLMPWSAFCNNHVFGHNVLQIVLC